MKAPTKEDILTYLHKHVKDGQSMLIHVEGMLTGPAFILEKGWDDTERCAELYSALLRGWRNVVFTSAPFAQDDLHAYDYTPESPNPAHS